MDGMHKDFRSCVKQAVDIKFLALPEDTNQYITQLIRTGIVREYEAIDAALFCVKQPDGYAIMPEIDQLVYELHGEYIVQDPRSMYDRFQAIYPDRAIPAPEDLLARPGMAEQLADAAQEAAARNAARAAEKTAEQVMKKAAEQVVAAAL